MIIYNYLYFNLFIVLQDQLYKDMRPFTSAVSKQLQKKISEEGGRDCRS